MLDIAIVTGYAAAMKTQIQKIAGYSLLIGSQEWVAVRLLLDEQREANVMDAHTSWSNAGLSPRWRVIRQAVATGCSDLSYED